MQPYFQKNRILVIHILFWCLYFSFFFYQTAFFRRNEEPDYVRSFYDATTQLFFIGLASYANYFIFLPRFLKHKKIGQYFIEFIIPFLAIMFIHVLVKRYIFSESSEKLQLFLKTYKFFFTHSFIAFFIVAFVGMLRFLANWFELEAKTKAIENERLTAELRFLKAQINPHFLFNTLNNLYYLATVNSPKTPDVIDKLSQMMRYMLYDSNHPKVSINKEIEYMKNYIDLENLRLDNKVPIKFDIVGDTTNKHIVPLIFITFLENAFKHGVSNNSKDAFVNIRIKIEGDNCYYSVENAKLSTKAAQEIAKSGIGLSNVKRRLELSYPNRYNLDVSETDLKYYIELSISLNDKGV
jgi:two-component system, LytTR family, sensor histidine kinase AlgZ